MSKPLRTLFAGSPFLAAATLENLLTLPDALDITDVWTQPDKPAGRGKNMRATPVADVASKYGLSLHKATRLAETERAILEGRRFDLAIVIAFGVMIPPEHLNLTRFGWWNIHPSALPRYRGASPLASAIKDGLSQTAVTLMLLDHGLDSGALIARRPLEIDPDCHTPQLENAVVEPATRLLHEAAETAQKGTLKWRPQHETQASYCGKISKPDGRVSFTRTAQDIYNIFRAFDPWPGVAFAHKNEWIKIVDCLPVRVENTTAGSILGIEENDLLVGCAEGALRLKTLQRPGRKAVSGKAMAAGLRLKTGDVLETIQVEDNA